jgi:hypothetical protein
MGALGSNNSTSAKMGHWSRSQLTMPLCKKAGEYAREQFNSTIAVALYKMNRNPQKSLWKGLRKVLLHLENISTLTEKYYLPHFSSEEHNAVVVAVAGNFYGLLAARSRCSHGKQHACSYM